MIENFKLQNFLSFKGVDLEFSKGLIVFTGPSGSGKSVLMESILALFGLKDAAALSSEAVVNYSVNAEDLGIENDDIYHFKQIKKEKVSLFLNNQRISKKALESLSGTFIRHLSLKDYSDFSDANLIGIFDEYLKSVNLEHETLLSEYADAYSKLKVASGELERVNEKQKKLVELKEFTQFEIDKISSINPVVGEDEELSSIKKALSKRDKLQESLGSAEAIFEYESAVSNVLELLDTQSAFFDETMNSLKDIFQNSIERLGELDEVNIEEVLDRIEALSGLKRRYGSIEEALEYRALKQVELENYEQIDSTQARLKEEVGLLFKQVKELSKEISLARQSVLSHIDNAINDYMRMLYLEGGKIKLVKTELGALGEDLVELSLHNATLKEVSSGEFNRVRLAILALKSTLKKEQGGILFLDEVDANLSGEESMSVANVLKELAKYYQIFSISHQPQLTSQANQHFLVTKNSSSAVRELTHEERIDEIARMVSGEIISSQAHKYAKTLLESRS